MNSQKPLFAQCLALVALVVALLPLDAHGFYVLLHFIVSVVGAYLAVISYQLARYNWVWILGALAVLYNPLIPVRLDREAWAAANLVSIVLIGLSIWKFRRQSKRLPEPNVLSIARNRREFETDASGYVYDAAKRTLHAPDGLVYRVLSASRSGASKLTFSAETPSGAVFKITLRGLDTPPDEAKIEERECKRCGRIKSTQYVFFIENISYFFARRERTFHGHICFSCMTKTFAIFEIRTLLGTWWGIIGMISGPGYLLENLIEYMKHSYRFVRSK